MQQLVIFLTGFFFVVTAFSAVEIPIRTGRSIRQQVDIYGELLQKEVAKVKSVKEKYKTISRVKSQIKELRASSSPQGLQDEAHMDLLVSVLEALPEQKSFKRKDCLKYESELLVEFEPVAEEKPQNPAVMTGWEVLQSLCQR